RARGRCLRIPRPEWSSSREHLLGGIRQQNVRRFAPQDQHGAANGIPYRPEIDSTQGLIARARAGAEFERPEMCNARVGSKPVAAAFELTRTVFGHVSPLLIGQLAPFGAGF